MSPTTPLEPPSSPLVVSKSLCSVEQISSLHSHPCYSGTSKLRPDLYCGCNSPHEKAYLIPKTQHILTSREVQNETMFIFIHVNKAAGETLLKNILMKSMEHNLWDGAGLGTIAGWQFLSSSSSSSSSSLPHVLPSTSTKPHNILYSQCGVRFSTLDQVFDFIYTQGNLFQDARHCVLRVLWGNSALGLCDHFPTQPCIYLTSLRHPLSRAISDYQYFCLDGMESRHKWTKGMLRQGKCKMGIIQWFIQMKTSPYFLIERLTKGCDRACGVELALSNLKNPCLRYLLVERFTEGLARLEQALNPVFSKAIAEYLESPIVLNTRQHHFNISKRDMEELGQLLKEDLAVYQEAERFYPLQWDQPLTSCN